MTIASDLFRTVTVKINDISQQLPYIVVNQADDNGKIIRFVPLDHGQKVTGFTGARLYYPPCSDNEYGDYVTGVESDGAWDFTIPVGILNVGRVGCNLAFIDGDGETYSRNVVFFVEPAVSGVFDPWDGQQTRLDKVVGTVQNIADTAIGTINETADSAVERVNKTASDAVESIGKAEESITDSVTEARDSAESAANSAQQASASASAAQTSERNVANSATQASQSATAAKQSEDNAASSAQNAASSAEQAANIVASVSGSVTQAENAARSASQSATAAGGSASAAGGNAQAAADSASKAGESATAAKVSETNAVSSASAAKISETNAAASATAAQNAVDGFGLEVGTTTTGEPGSDAAVEIQKNGTKYTASFTIPRGDVGPAGVNENVPLGSTSGVVAQGTDAYPTLPRKVQVHGRTVENLFKNFSYKLGGVTINCDESGLFSFSGTTTTGRYPNVAVTLKPNIKYTLSVYGTLTGISQVYVEYHVSSSNSTVWNAVGPLLGTTTKTFVTASDITSAKCGFELKQGENVTASVRVMLVESDTVPDVFVPSGVHTVEPTKLIVAGKNLIPIGNISSGSYKGINWKANDDKTFTISGTTTDTVDIPFIPSGSRWSLPKGRYTVKAIGDLQNNIQVFISQVKESSWFTSLNNEASVKNIDIDEDIVFAECSVRIPSGVTLENSVYGIQIELGDSDTSYETPNIKSLDFTQSISLSDGDTLDIDRDGTTQIIHTEGEPTVLDNVALPELPAPTFNVYTTGGYIQPTVDVDYERDVNLVLQALAAKIASLEVTQTIMQGA